MVMVIYKSLHFRLYPTLPQQTALTGEFGCARFVYNHFLAVRVDHYQRYKQNLGYEQTAKQLTQLKRQPGYEWLQAANAQSLQQSLQDLEAAFRHFLAGRAKHPKFKRKHDKQSVRIPQGFSIEGTGKRIKLVLPKLGAITMIAHRPVTGKMKSVTLSKIKSGRYYASILCEVEIPEPVIKGGEIGVDVGLVDFAVSSDGQKVPAPRYLRYAEKKLVRTQRKLSRSQLGSAGYEKTRLALARQHEKVANQRADFQHKLSYRLVQDNQLVAVESLAVKNMMANHRLAKAIADAAWGRFLSKLAYKGIWYGCRIGQINRFFPSSKRCSACGTVVDKLPLHLRSWTCSACGLTVDRDINAALNILQEYRRNGGN